MKLFKLFLNKDHSSYHNLHLDTVRQEHFEDHLMSVLSRIVNEDIDEMQPKGAIAQ